MIQLTLLTSSSKAESDQEVSENKDDFTCSGWVGSTHRLAAEHPCGIAKNALKTYIASAGKTDSTGKKHLCVCWAQLYMGY